MNCHKPIVPHTHRISPSQISLICYHPHLPAPATTVEPGVVGQERYYCEPLLIAPQVFVFVFVIENGYEKYGVELRNLLSNI